MYFANSDLTFGASITRPIMLGTIIAKIIASEKPITEPKLAAAPITTKTQNNNL